MPPLTILDIVNLTHQILNLNAVYLGVSIAIILGSGIALYFVNLKPIQDKINKQRYNLKKEIEKNENKFDLLKKDIEEAQNKSEEKILQMEKGLTKTSEEKLAQLGKKMQEIESLAREEIKKINDKANFIELNSLWDAQYMWGLGSVAVEINVLSSLSAYLVKSIEYEQQVIKVESCLDNIIKTIGRIKKAGGDSAGNKEYKERIYNDLVISLAKINGNEEKKKIILEEGKILFK